MFKLLLIFLAIFVIVSVKLGHLVIPPCLVIGIVIAVMFPIIARLTAGGETAALVGKGAIRSEEHTSELQSLMRISYAVFCLKKKKKYIILTLKAYMFIRLL